MRPNLILVNLDEDFLWLYNDISMVGNEWYHNKYLFLYYGLVNFMFIKRLTYEIGKLKWFSPRESTTPEVYSGASVGRTNYFLKS